MWPRPSYSSSSGELQRRRGRSGAAPHLRAAEGVEAEELKHPPGKRRGDAAALRGQRKPNGSAQDWDALGKGGRGDAQAGMCGRCCDLDRPDWTGALLGRAKRHSCGHTGTMRDDTHLRLGRGSHHPRVEVRARAPHLVSLFPAVPVRTTSTSRTISSRRCLFLDKN